MQFKERIVLIAVLIFVTLTVSGCVFKQGADKQNESVERLDPVDTENEERITLGHSNYDFQLKYPTYLIEGDITPTAISSLMFPESYTTGTNLIEADILVNRNGRSCEEFGYGSESKPVWRNGKKVVLDPKFKETIFVGDVEFKRMFCAGVINDVNIDALVYMSESAEKPLGLSLVLVSENSGNNKEVKLFDPAVFEQEYLKIMETYKKQHDTNDNNE